MQEHFVLPVLHEASAGVRRCPAAVVTSGMCAGISLKNLFLMHAAGLHTHPEVCVGDLSYCVPHGSNTSPEQHSSLAHTAPEVVSGLQSTADSPQMAWAVGMVLWELFSGLPPACMAYKEGFQASMDLVLGVSEGHNCKSTTSRGAGTRTVCGRRRSLLGRVLRNPERDDRIDWVLRGLLRANPAFRMSLQAAYDIIGSLWKDMQSCSYPAALQVSPLRNLE